MYQDLNKQWKEIEDKMGLTALELIKSHFTSMYQRIQDLITSRDNWKFKYLKLKELERRNKK